MSKTFIVDNYSKPALFSDIVDNDIVHYDRSNRTDIVLDNPSFKTKHIVLQSINY